MASQPTIEERFWAKVNTDGDCWLWQASVSSTGYGAFTIHYPRKIGAHRFSYYLSRGRCPPAGLTIDHLCRNRACVRPDHLEAVTLRENILRGECPAARNARKTNCDRGHPLTARADGHRYCRQCHADAERRAWQSGRRRTSPSEQP